MAREGTYERIQYLVQRPNTKSDTCYDINGYTFYTTAQDKKSTYQNSGVCIEVVDNEDEKIAYYGKIGDIWELNYSDFKVLVLRCC